MEESPGAKEGFKCCSMCMRHCFETHGDFGRSEAEELFSAPSFCSLIKTSHMTGSKFLRIPVLFMEKQNYNIGDKLSLKGPCGFESDVTVQRHSNGYVFRTGFNLFMQHHMIEAGDLLVFNLIAKSSFLVKVYDNCGIEKKSLTRNSSTDAEPVDPKYRSRSKESRHEEDLEHTDGEGVDEGSDEEAVDRLLQKQLSKEAEVIFREEKKERSCSNQQEPSFAQPAANLQENCVDVCLVNKDAGDVGDMKQLVSTGKQRSGHKRKLPAMPDAYHRGENENQPDKSSEFDRRKEAAERQAYAANALIQRLNNPSQLVVMAHSHVNTHACRVYLSKLPLSKTSTILTLVVSAREQYTVKWSVPSKGSRSRLATGWNQLVIDHNLDIDDVCVFEANDIHLITVHIFRLADYYNPTTENQQQEQDHRDDLRPSALEQSLSEELDCLGEQADTGSAGFCQTAKRGDKRPGPDSKDAHVES